MSQKLEAIFRPKHRELTKFEQDSLARIKSCALELAKEFYPADTRFKALALTKLEESVMWAVKGVTE